MAITAAQVKELRERSGAAMMDCKRALTATGGDIEAAIEKMRKDGLAKADKKASRTAAEGVIRIVGEGSTAVIIEVNCETDFVAKNDSLLGMADAAANAVLAGKADTIEALLEVDHNGDSIDAVRRGLVAKLGENISLRRFEKMDAPTTIGRYLHGDRIGVIVGLDGGDDALAKDVAMHIAATNPQFVSPDDVSDEVKEKEKAILVAQAEESGKPKEIIEKMIGGRLNKFLAEITLTGQPFVKDPDQTVGKLLKAAGASVTGFTRYEVGEGIEKEETDFAEEVKAQAAAAMKG